MHPAAALGEGSLGWFFLILFLLFPASVLSSMPCQEQALLVPPVPSAAVLARRDAAAATSPLPRARRVLPCVNVAGGLAPSRWSGAAGGTQLLCTTGWEAGSWCAPSAWAAPEQHQVDISLLLGLFVNC